MEIGQCAYCARFQAAGECDAFPCGIPDEIYDGTFDHRQPYSGDNGLRWIPNGEGAAEIFSASPIGQQREDEELDEAS